ncbi:DUF1090 domain-containing protein [Klebsiella spallanzanii]|uniref:DUF1090 domain-containing protein n=1 Tax=Klebsiella spallanzanii TaxID=2587528 RepID=UPI0025918E88|nr:DUF1090 domain-containing protein [Klebsiella spallanzanii]MDM4208900.1 DUF1090 domain-containing protein [Klebsiella spallanzanii]
MKKIKTALTYLTIISAFSSFGAYAANELKGCAAKEQQIQQQIDYATKHGNNHRISGLEKALSELRQNCTDEKLTQERKNKISEKEKKVTERMTELNQAKETGNADKINKKEKKLQEAKSELLEAQSELNK